MQDLNTRDHGASDPAAAKEVRFAVLFVFNLRYVTGVGAQAAAMWKAMEGNDRYYDEQAQKGTWTRQTKPLVNSFFTTQE